MREFETYRLLNFDYPHQVYQFIDNWFSNGDAQKKERLKAELENPEKALWRNLIQNPLLLTLLCASVQSPEGNFPNTKAGLSAMFVEQFYKWKSERFPISHQEQSLLNQALGLLSCQALDLGNNSFGLRESFIREAMGDDCLFDKAVQIGWLNNVGIAEECSTQEKVYDFFHASFKEYFAALVVEDWDDFLPRNHVNKPVEGKQYRIFESQWKKVILLWLGRIDVNKEEKEGFIEALVEFKDGCKDFYSERAYLLAAAGISEFKDCSLADEIVEQIVKWSFGYFEQETEQWMTYFDPLSEAAKAVLAETDYSRAIAALGNLIRHAEDEDVRWLVTHKLGEIAPGNEIAIQFLISLLETIDGEGFSNLALSESFEKIAQGNQTAIGILIKLLKFNNNELIRYRAALCLGRIAKGNAEAIHTLVSLLESNAWQKFSLPDNFRYCAAEGLALIDPGNQKAMKALVDLLENAEEEDTRYWTAITLETTAKDNQEVINTMIDLLQTTSYDDDRLSRATRILGKIALGHQAAIESLICLLESIVYESRDERFMLWQNAEDTESEDFEEFISFIRRDIFISLGKIGIGNQAAIQALVHLLETTNNKTICLSTAQSLGKIDPGNQIAIDTLMDLLENPDDLSISFLAESLAEISPDKQVAINALINFLEANNLDVNHADYLSSIQILGNLAKENEAAINILVHILETTKHDTYRYYAAESLGKIAQGNDSTIQALVHSLQMNNFSNGYSSEFLNELDENLLAIVQNFSRIKNVAGVLQTLLQKSQSHQWVVAVLKPYLSDVIYERDSRCYEACYEVIWHCAQTLSYREFYQA